MSGIFLCVMADEPNVGGRPLKFDTAEALQEQIDQYFLDALDDEGNYRKPISITGLALHLDTTRETLMDYQKRDGFSDAVKKAKLRIENYYEEHLLVGKPTGPIFALKNFGWKDSQQHEHGGPNGGPIKVEEIDNGIIARTLALMAKARGE